MSVQRRLDHLTSAVKPLGLRMPPTKPEPTGDVKGETKSAFLGNRTGPYPSTNRGVASGRSTLPKDRKAKRTDSNPQTDQSLYTH